MNKFQRILVISAVILVALYFIIRLVVFLLMSNSPTLGVVEGKLVDCPDYPACVSSFADPEDEIHYVERIENSMPIETARKTIITMMESVNGAFLVAEEDNYLHYEIRVAPFGFVDDIEFYFPEDGGSIEIRSSARVPYYDFDVNRKRVEELRERFNNF